MGLADESNATSFSSLSRPSPDPERSPTALVVLMVSPEIVSSENARGTLGRGDGHIQRLIPASYLLTLVIERIRDPLLVVSSDLVLRPPRGLLRHGAGHIQRLVHASRTSKTLSEMRMIDGEREEEVADVEELQRMEVAVQHLHWGAPSTVVQ